MNFVNLTVAVINVQFIAGDSYEFKRLQLKITDVTHHEILFYLSKAKLLKSYLTIESVGNFRVHQNSP